MPNRDKGSIIGHAWRITRQFKILWFFGFLATLGLPSSGIGSLTVAALVQGMQQRVILGGAWIFQAPGSWIQPFSLSLMATITLSFALWAVGLVARAALIHGADVARHRLDRKKRTGGQKRRGEKAPKDVALASTLRSGINVLPRLAAMQAVLWLPVVVLNVVAALSQMHRGTSAVAAGNPPGFDALAGLLATIASVGSVVLVIVDTFAFRAIVLDGARPLESIRTAATILRVNLGQVLQVILGLLVAFIPFVCILGTMLLPLTLSLGMPDVQAMRACMAEGGKTAAELQECVMQAQLSNNPFSTASRVGLFLVTAAISTVYATFASSVGTLLYRALVKRPAFTS